MNTVIPYEFRVEVAARRVGGVVQPDGATVIAPPNTVTYDVTSITPGVVFFGQGLTPYDRVVSPSGIQVDIQAASFRARGMIEMFEGSPRLSLREGIVWADCTGG